MRCKTLHLLFLLQLAVLPALFSQTNEQLRANLYAFQNGTAYIYDGNLTMYNATNSNAVDDYDAVKMSNFGENFGLQRGSTTLVIERRASINTADTVFFKMWNMRKTTYKIELMLTGLNRPGLTGVLEDLYLNTKTNLDLNGITSLNFYINSVVASARSDRFRIIFANSLMNAPLPVTFTNMTAYRHNNDVSIEWKVENEKTITQYQVQRSLNGRQFSSASTITSNGHQTSMYKWVDNSVINDNNFYRISSIDISGHVQYSNVIKVASMADQQEIAVYPNPVVNGVINLQLKNQPKGIYTARLFNNFGQLVNIVQATHNGGNNTLPVQVNKNLNKGNYTLEIVKPDNTKTNTKIVLQ